MRVNVAMIDKDGNLTQIEGSGKTFKECIESVNEDFKNLPKTEIDIREIYNSKSRAT